MTTIEEVVSNVCGYEVYVGKKSALFASEIAKMSLYDQQYGEHSADVNTFTF